MLDTNAAAVTAVVSWYTFTTAPFSVLKCGDAFPADDADEYNWNVLDILVVGMILALGRQIFPAEVIWNTCVFDEFKN